MKGSRSYSLGLPAAVLLAMAGLSFQTQDASTQDATASLGRSVGVVDALRVFNAFPDAVAGRAKLEEMSNQFTLVAEQHRRRIEELELDYQKFVEGTQDRDLVGVELRVARLRLQGLIEVFDRRLRNESRPFVVDMYDRIWAAVDKVAEAKGLELVFRVRRDHGAELDVRRANNDMRSVLYAAPHLDLTQDVINTLKAGG